MQRRREFRRMCRCLYHTMPRVYSLYHIYFIFFFFSFLFFTLHVLLLCISLASYVAWLVAHFSLIVRLSVSLDASHLRCRKFTAPNGRQPFRWTPSLCALTQTWLGICYCWQYRNIGRCLYCCFNSHSHARVSMVLFRFLFVSVGIFCVYILAKRFENSKYLTKFK